MPNPELLSIKQAAARKGVSADTIRRWVNSKRLPAQRVGTDWVILASDVDATEAPRPGPVKKPPKEKHPGTRRRAPNVKDSLGQIKDGKAWKGAE